MVTAKPCGIRLLAETFPSHTSMQVLTIAKPKPVPRGLQSRSRHSLRQSWTDLHPGRARYQSIRASGYSLSSIFRRRPDFN